MGLEWGDKIPGSRLIRVFCRSCGTPMRASPATIYPSLIVCERCRTAQPKSYTKMHKPLDLDDRAPELEET